MGYSELSVLKSCRLYYKDGSSDKEYHASINEVDGGYMVTFAFGRRGSALNTGTKTTSPVALEKAQQIYDKLVAEKTGKGYAPDGSGALFAMTENQNRQSGLTPQLLNPIDSETARKYLTDDEWCIQEKFDGKRIMVSVVGGIVTGSNRKGLVVSHPQELSDALG
jgi:bifunctional non-homologous end joining protein LigD